ncbi:MAG: trypsin-like serine protease [Halobacteriovoraceae bacterium]|nr:trypsin-like serine protease [Halobacteriovoraceae bacterium]
MKVIGCFIWIASFSLVGCSHTKRLRSLSSAEIINGVKVKDDQILSSVSLFLQEEENNNLVTTGVCSGVIISERHILTAGHCANDRKYHFKVNLRELENGKVFHRAYLLEDPKVYLLEKIRRSQADPLDYKKEQELQEELGAAIGGLEYELESKLNEIIEKHYPNISSPKIEKLTRKQRENLISWEPQLEQIYSGYNSILKGLAGVKDLDLAVLEVDSPLFVHIASFVNQDVHKNEEIALIGVGSFARDFSTTKEFLKNPNSSLKIGYNKIKDVSVNRFTSAGPYYENLETDAASNFQLATVESGDSGGGVYTLNEDLAGIIVQGFHSYILSPEDPGVLMKIFMMNNLSPGSDGRKIIEKILNGELED